jgi:hypothetical protein
VFLCMAIPLVILVTETSIDTLFMVQVHAKLKRNYMCLRQSLKLNMSSEQSSWRSIAQAISR